MSNQSLKSIIGHEYRSEGFFFCPSHSSGIFVWPNHRYHCLPHVFQCNQVTQELPEGSTGEESDSMRHHAMFKQAKSSGKSGRATRVRWLGPRHRWRVDSRCSHCSPAVGFPSFYLCWLVDPNTLYLSSSCKIDIEVSCSFAAIFSPVWACFRWSKHIIRHRCLQTLSIPV